MSTTPIPQPKPLEIAAGIIGEIAGLEPIALGLVMSLVRGLKGKSDAEILQGDAADWASIVSTAHAEASATP
jgi:hypothetical protein